MARGLITLRENSHIPYIMSKMFDFDLETSDIEKDLFSVQEKMEPIFNFIDLSFQLLDGPVDEKVASMIEKLNELRRSQYAAQCYDHRFVQSMRKKRQNFVTSTGR